MRLLLLLALLIGSPTTAQRQSPPNSSPPEQMVSNAHPLWKLDVRRLEPEMSSPNLDIVSDSERVFYLQGGQVKAVDAKTGQQVWAFRVGKWAQLKYAPGSLVAITEKGKIYALELRTGRVRWSKTGYEGFYSADEEALYIAEEGRLRALDLETGRTRWTTDAPLISPYKSLTVSKNYIFIPMAVADAMSAATLIFDARTGKSVGEASTRGPLAILDQRAFFRNDWFHVDYPDRFYIDVHNLRTGKLLEDRTYSVENRVKGDNWNSKVAISGAVYISGGGNIACFPLAQPGGDAKPDFIRVPEGDVTWLAGPFEGTFLLEWRGAVWLVRQSARDNCAPINLLERGHRIGSGKPARFSFLRKGLYLSLKNGSFYAVDLQTGKIGLKLKFATSSFGPTHVVGDTLIVQVGNNLLAFALPRELKL